MKPAAQIHRYLPQRTPPEDLEAIFVAREPIVEELLQRLGRNRQLSSRQHYLFIGPRGIGKTFLLAIIRHRIRTGPLGESWVPVALSEEGYRFGSVANLLLDALHILGDCAGDHAVREAYDTLSHDSDDSRVVDLSLDVFRSFHRRSGKRVLLMVENVNRILDRQMGRNARQVSLLRKILIEEDWLVMLATSPMFVNAATEPDAPFFEFFRVTLLQELSREEQVSMLRKLAELENSEAFNEYLHRFKSRLQALYHFTGGNPRLALMLYDLIAHQRIVDVQAELDALLDQLTPFYQDRMRDLADQEALLLERMALLPEGCSPTELAREARMEAKTVRTLLVRLEKAGYVRREQRRKKQTVYIIPERFFRIWHQLSCSRAARGRVQYLLEFFSTWYSSQKERDQIWEELIEGHKQGVADEDEDRVVEVAEFMDYIAAVSEGKEKYEREFDALRLEIGRSGIGPFERRLSALDEEYAPDVDYHLAKGRFLAREFKDQKRALGAFEDAVSIDPINPSALYNLAVALDKLGCPDEALSTYEKAAVSLTKQNADSYGEEIEDLLLKTLQVASARNLVWLAANVLGRTGTRSIMDKIIAIGMAAESWRRQYCANALGLLGDPRALGFLVELLGDRIASVRGSAATALGRVGSERAVDPLIVCLTDEATNVRGSAANALGLVGSERAVDSLIACLTDKASNVRGSAANALGLVGSERAVDSLIACLTDKASNVRGSAANALGLVGSERAVDSLIACLTDKASNVRGSAANALGLVGSERAVDALIACLTDEASDVRGSAANALGLVGSVRAVDSLIACLADEASKVRGSAANALGRVGSERAVEALIACLTDEASKVRGSAATALGRVGSERAVEALIACLADQASRVRGSAATALGRVGSERAVDPLIACLTDEASNVRGSAANALGLVGSERAVNSLIACLTDEGSNVRGSAATALGRLGSEDAVEPLLQCLRDEAETVRARAAESLGYLHAHEATTELLRIVQSDSDFVCWAAVTALGRIAVDQPVLRFAEVFEVVMEEAPIDEGQRIEIGHHLLESAFRSSNLQLIRDSVDIALRVFEEGEAILAPHVTALRFIDSDRAPAILERQNPEMREAAMLLVDLFDGNVNE